MKKYLEKIGFWDKLFTACVRKEDADLLVEEINSLSTKNKTSEELIEALKLENEKQKKLISEQRELLDLNKESLNVKNRDISAAEDTITALHVTIGNLKETIRRYEKEKDSLVSEASTKCENIKGVTAMPVPAEDKRGGLRSDEDDLRSEASKPKFKLPEAEKPKKKEIPLKKLRVRDQTEYVTKFIKTINLKECAELKVRIIESVKNDAKKKVTVDNIINNKKLDTIEETIQLFKTALTRRRTALRDWFDKYDIFVASR